VVRLGQKLGQSGAVLKGSRLESRPVPELDYALISDYVRAEGALAHVIGAGIDTIYAPQVPAGQNIGLLIRLTFARSECGRAHRVEVFFQDEDGQRLAELNGTVTPEWIDDPPGGRVGLGLTFNIGVPLPQYGNYSFELLVNDTLMKSIPLRVVLPRESPG
jgi:hypothetical protein